MGRLTMQNLSDRVPGQPVSSESATNTVKDAGTAGREMTAPGSPSVLPVPPDADTDVALDVAAGPYRQPSTLIGKSGGTGSRPGTSGGPDTTFQSGSGWQQT